jgi:hypothetical protein
LASPPGDAHAFTFCCFRRQPFLQKDRGRQSLVEAIGRARGKLPLHVWANVIMPVHGGDNYPFFAFWT